MKIPTQKELKEILDYNSNTGIFIWKTKPSRQIKKGQIAGSDHHSGYIFITISKKKHAAHRLAFLYMTGSIPEVVDHIDRNKTNNKWNNLREATQSNNCCNRIKSKNKSSMYKGVFFKNDGRKNPWIARIMINKKYVTIGSFNNEIDAAKAYDKKAISHYKEFALLNFKENKYAHTS